MDIEQEFQTFVKAIIGVRTYYVREPYKLCDIYPAYGYVFEKNYKDLIIGDIQTVFREYIVD